MRTLLAQLVWTAAVVVAAVLAVGALLVAIGANTENDLVRFVLDLADGVDLGVFSRENGIRQFGGDNAEVKNALFNWGLGAVAYLVVGRVVARLVSPGKA
ncbi:hypothetical protein [Nocardioides bruguierae]|uniref:hypothetical protein n=1 Tax=Nocardioides bruguierae TaxID=2945102 RepID=UPI002020A183|nr:hypothetical protein [Nocardioides bruguierae]MCL8024714.1 hypothetical protein [Nocardioides bruguierae]